MAPQTFNIGTLASRAGVSVQAVRLYERQGLLKPAYRKPSGYRVYGVPELMRLAAIVRAKSLGFRLKEIKPLLGRRGEAGRRSLLKKKEEIEDRIGHLKLLLGRLEEQLGRKP